MTICCDCGLDKPLTYKNKTQCQACYRNERRRERGLRKPGPKLAEGPPEKCPKGHHMGTSTNVRVDVRPDGRKRYRCKACYRAESVLRNYGLTVDQYEQMLIDHENCCAICSAPFGINPRNVHVDHCHTTGKVRGLLCPDCNRGIGLFRDSIEILTRAVNYLS